MKRWMILLVTVMMVNFCFQTVCADEKKKKKTVKKEEPVVRTPVKKLGKYERLFKGKSHETAKGEDDGPRNAVSFHDHGDK